MVKNKKVKTAFSLLELSIVITVAAVIITGNLATKTVNVGANKEVETRKKMTIIYKAIGDYLLKNKRLPCPAPIDVVKGDSNYGVASANSDGAVECPASPAPGIRAVSTSRIRGMVPVKTLGLKDEFAEDAYGSKIVYAVDKRFTRIVADLSSNTTSFAGLSGTTSIMTVRRTNSSTAYSYATLTSNALIVLVSYGKNKNGAFPADSTIPNLAPPALLGTEVLNDTSTAAKTTFYVSSKDSGFDDIVFYKTKFQMIRDFKAEHLVGCAGTNTSGTGYLPQRGYVGQVAYKACSNSNVKLTKECRINTSGLGTWVEVVKSC